MVESKRCPLVSIIVPTYNRAHLIDDTLDSILAQTYQNWECIVVDDGSTDHTDALMADYISKDSRFRYYHRPKDRLPGGNAARNYGFEQSKGEYIQWFDSDDLMVPKKLESKVKTILGNDVDFVISKTKYFNIKKKKPYDYNYTEDEVNFISYSTTHLSWFTPDIFIKRAIAKKINFNEFLKAGQEYNFSCKLLLQTNKLKKIDKFLTLRRYHLDSIGNKRQQDKAHYWRTLFDLHWANYNELNKDHDVPEEFNQYALLKCTRSYLSEPTIDLPKSFHKTIIKFFKWKAIYFYLAIASKWTFNKYHFFYVKLK
tara:strand:- start:1368 stop:2306 length:939 start_codon:yes stop_codon:yes gene_type:complete